MNLDQKIYMILHHIQECLEENERDDFFIDIKEIRECLKILLEYELFSSSKEMTMTMMIIRYLLKERYLNAELSAIYLAFSGHFIHLFIMDSFPKFNLVNIDI